MTSVVDHVASGIANQTLPGLLVGDYVLILAYRYDNSNAMPTSSPNFSRISAGSNGSQYLAVYEHFVTADGDVTSDLDWVGITNPTYVVMIAFRGVLSRGEVDRDTGAGTLITYGDLVLPASDGSAWVVTFLGHKSASPDMTTAVADLALVDSGARYAISAGPRSEWAGEAINYGGSTSLAWISVSIALEGELSGGPTPRRLRMPMMLGSL